MTNLPDFNLVWIYITISQVMSNQKSIFFSIKPVLIGSKIDKSCIIIYPKPFLLKNLIIILTQLIKKYF